MLSHSIVEIGVGNATLHCNLCINKRSTYIKPITWDLLDSSFSPSFGSSTIELTIKVKHAKVCQLETSSQSQFLCHLAPVKSFSDGLGLNENPSTFKLEVLALWTSSKSYFWSKNAHLTSMPLSLFNFMSHLKGWWLIIKVNVWPYKMRDGPNCGQLFSFIR